MRLFVKICGVTRPADARLAVSLGASHIGVVRSPTSPRSATRDQATAVFEAVRGKAETVLVCRDVAIDQVLDDAKTSGAKAVQLYRSTKNSVRLAEAAGLRVYRALSIDEGASSLPAIKPLPSETRPAVLDVGGGGTGRHFDWSLLGERAPDATFIAGGISPDNVHELLPFRPYGIDLSSSVESSPGVKDEAKLRALFKEVR